MNANTKLFLRFLKETSMYEKYVRRYRKSTQGRSKHLFEFLSSVSATSYVIGAFPWVIEDDPPNNYQLFNKLHSEWGQLLYDIKQRRAFCGVTNGDIYGFLMIRVNNYMDFIKKCV